MEYRKMGLRKIAYWRIAALLIAMTLACTLALAGCGTSGSNNSNGAGDAEDSAAKQNLPVVTNMAGDVTAAEVCDNLSAAGLSNVTVFGEWVADFARTAGKDAGLSDEWASPGAFTPDIAKCMDGWEKRYDYSDSDCRMTAMLLLDGLLTAEKTDSKYDGTYLMFDVDAIENVPKYEALKKNLALFTTVFGDRTPQKGEDPADTLGRIWNEYGLAIDSNQVSLLSVVIYDPDFDQVFVGHTGVLVKQSDNAYLFVEKFAFEQPYQATLVSDVDQLLDLLAKRADYFGSEGDAGPYVYLNDQYLGELEYTGETVE